MSRVAYLDCIGGLAGDMLLAALLDAGGQLETLRGVPSALGIEGVRIDAKRVERHGIGALHVTVDAPDDHHQRPYAHIRELVERADLPERARLRSLDAFRRLAEVEGGIHGVAPDEVHFHELGSLDAIVDVCGAFTLLEELAIDRVCSSPLPFARGFVQAAHGMLPLPAPASLGLLAGASFTSVDVEGELITPTGAAVAAVAVEEWGSPPPLTLERVGYGAGTKDFASLPNVVRVLTGTVAQATSPVVVLETNLDDFSPELVPDAVERCFAAGALDVWTTPAQMKKGRPGFVLSVLARPDARSAVARAILEQTSALGVRVSRLERYELEREERSVEVSGASVRVKLGLLDGRVVNVAPEHDDCVLAARVTGRSVKSVWAEALARAQDL